MSDTVGFIRDLPHHLIESFKATLEEARQADLLLHVADASNPAAVEQIAAAYRVLDEIGIREKDTLLVLNKIDAVGERARLDALRNRYPSAIADQRPDRARPAGADLGRQRCAEPRVCRRRRRDGRGQRPADGAIWPRGARCSRPSITTAA